METVDSSYDITQDDFNKIWLEYQSVKNKIMMKIYKSEKELEELTMKKQILNEEWNFEEGNEENNN